MAKIDRSKAPRASGTRYPPQFAAPVVGREWLKLGDAAGLTQLGVNLLTLRPGVWSSQRHWHTHEDELVYVLAGEVVLVTDDGEELLGPGDSVGFPAGVANGHCLQNRSATDATLLVAGTRSDADGAQYPDIDLVARPGRYAGKGGYTKKDGTPY